MTGPKRTTSHWTDSSEELESQGTIPGKMTLTVPRFLVAQTPQDLINIQGGRRDEQGLREKTDPGVSGWESLWLFCRL